MRILIRGLSPLLLFLITTPLAAQQDAAEQQDQIRRIEQRLEELSGEIDSLRRQLDELRGVPSAPLDLTQIETVAPPPQETEAAPEPPVPEALDTTLVQNVTPAGATKALNPDISVIGNFVGFTGSNPFSDEPVASLEEVEMSLQAFVDPYAKANFFLGIGEEGIEVEEGYATFVALPYDFTAKAGKMRANFGKANLLHTHQRPWVDVPLVHATFFGEEGALADSGISVSKLVPNPFGGFAEATVEVFSGDAEGVFEPEERTDLLYLGHLKFYRDITENSNFEVGGSYARGGLPEVGGTNQFAGMDLTFRYKPLQRAIYRSFISRTEFIVNDREDLEDQALGFYTSADYQFSRRWFAGLRLDQVDRPDLPGLTDRSGSFTLTFWPSEFSQIRGQFRRIDFDHASDANEFLLQLQFSIGPHGAHTF